MIVLLGYATRCLLPYRSVLWRESNTQLSWRRARPVNVDIGVHAGTFHGLALPNQLSDAGILLVWERIGLGLFTGIGRQLVNPSLRCFDDTVGWKSPYKES